MNNNLSPSLSFSSPSLSPSSSSSIDHIIDYENKYEDHSDIFYRPIQSNDYKQIKELHDYLFPVKYSDHFFRSVVEGKCVRDGIKLFSSIAVKKYSSSSNSSSSNSNCVENKEEIVGFILAQTMLTKNCEDRDNIFTSSSSFSSLSLSSSSNDDNDNDNDNINSNTNNNNNNQTKEVCYILTLGLKRGMRRTGIGSILLQQCIEFASRFETCGAIYLHVISYNIPGIRFYEKNNFILVKHHSDYYNIGGRHYSAETFVYYLHNITPPFSIRFYNLLSQQATNYILSTVRWIETNLFGSDQFIHWINSLTTNNQGNISPYMDDITLPQIENDHNN